MVINSIFGLKALKDLGYLDKVEVHPISVAPLQLGIALADEKFQKADMDKVNKIIAIAGNTYN